ncbi:phosphogluconate dehydratase [Acetobacteraceae bacterium]|nr:phosphogluconate dehydratase [Acetobacteraceae bacterium]
MSLNPVVEAVTADIRKRSAKTRTAYLQLMKRNKEKGISRPKLACGNLAHAVAACSDDKPALIADRTPNIGIITSYNDVLSAHQPYANYPNQMRIFAREAGATAQVAGGVPAMCDGVTQGQEGMDLSLFSRETIALSTAIGLSHGMFDAVALLGVCDKIVPGLLIGALRFGHLPTMFFPAGPMTSGLPNKEKIRIRQLYAQKKIGKDELLKAEMESYHAPGTCTFYGTANSNQMLVEVMGLMMPDGSFVNADTKLRQEMIRNSTHRLAKMSHFGSDERTLAECVDERAIVNAIVGLMATGGSTNLTMHIPAIARAAGIKVTWEDFERLSKEVPLLCRVYPNGPADVNAFRKAGGLPFVINQLMKGGLLHDICTVSEDGYKAYCLEANLDDNGKLVYAERKTSGDEDIIRPIDNPFQKDGGMLMLKGNLGRGVYKISAVQPEHQSVEAPCRVFETQQAVVDAYENGELNKDVVIVLRGQGPQANGMPELHRLMPLLGVLQDEGRHVAVVTDGRMSGASGKVPSALHVYPEAVTGGPISLLRDGDVVRLCGKTGELSARVDEKEWAERKPQIPVPEVEGTGRELFAIFRHSAPALPEDGASSMLHLMDEEIEALHGGLTGRDL